MVGKPICLDKQTAQLNPIKFVGVLVQLKYGSSYPRGVWVPVINEEDGSIVKVKVSIEYSAVPQSCKFCQAFGYPESKCESNPLYEANRRNNKPKAASCNNKDAEEGNKTADADVATDAVASVDEDAIENVNEGTGIDIAGIEVAVVGAGIEVAVADVGFGEGNSENGEEVMQEGNSDSGEAVLQTKSVEVNKQIGSTMQTNDVEN